MCEEPLFTAGNEDTNSDVVYAEDWEFITVSLDGAIIITSPQENIRALSVDSARTSYNYFEVVFYSKEGSKLARSSWELGKKASVDKVPRNINYSHTGDNIAMLLAGRLDYTMRPDNPDNPLPPPSATLLAIGVLVSVDGEDGTLVTGSSREATFKLYPLIAGVSPVYEPNENFDINNEDYDFLKVISPDLNLDKSSFFTNSLNPSGEPSITYTDVLRVRIGVRNFPLYRLPPGEPNVKASYEFKLDGADWDDYAKNLYVHGFGTAEKRQARYPVGNNNYRYPVYNEDLTTTVEMISNQSDGSIIENPVFFHINTEKTNNSDKSLNGIFTLVFGVPIYAVSDEDCENGNEAVIWHLRPAHATHLYNIDNGFDNVGGAILIGVDIDGKDIEIPVSPN